ncbi:helicase [Flexivirga endophytica]|uniref:Helicase n=1 Tax=Flexivirga endophytica TaxID=1849103 RepID=A0A916WU22_9MICO|nr:DEAD/DEAH box helicase [Flexivirga endophytica]GGB29803.1 helicase [Flexivirga endophytica]GHB50790.1 helicase [Flexivirga endophytica]
MDPAVGQIRLDNTFGFLDRTAGTDQLFHPLLVSNRDDNTMARAIRAELRRSRSFTFSVAFVTPNAVALLKQALLDFPGQGTIITSTYQGFNSPAAFRELLNLPGVRVLVHPSGQAGFHAKGYVFDQDASTTAIVGSSNLTSQALLKNHEWNLRFSALPDGDIVEQLDRAVAAQVAESTPLTHRWIDAYTETWHPPATRHFLEPDPEPLASTTGVVPNRMQADALAEIEQLRRRGERRGIVVSATGTGKTILAALDVRAAAPERMLFVVHREQILDRAIQDFQRVLGAPAADFGKLAGPSREPDRKYVFATVQSLTRPATLAQIASDAFDYVLVDEVHRAGADSYRRLIDHLSPSFLLGVTATPERTDGFNVFELFDFNLAYEIRLQQALEDDMLAPFHYYGVTDFQQNGRAVNDASQLGFLVSTGRVDHLVQTLETYGHVGVPVRGLMFCSRTDEAHELSQRLNERLVHGRRLRTEVLTGKDLVARREAVVAELENGGLDYILTVDVFNEGIDIPTVNQVVLLRQTESSIIFTQQLGRGLRKAAGKDYLVVIDFVGNYSNNYLIPIALFGDNSLNKDSIRRRMIDAQEAGAISGLSSVNFDTVSRERVFASLAATKLDSVQNLKRTIGELARRLGRTPRLLDFARFDAADPVVVAGKRDNYWKLLWLLKRSEDPPGSAADALLSFLSIELLNGKRPHELLLLRTLLSTHTGVDRTTLRAFFEREGCSADDGTIESVLRVLSLAFFTAAERQKYGEPPLSISERRVELNPAIRELLRHNARLTEHVDDVIETGLFLARHRYRWTGSLEVGKRYSRKDVCRLLNWTKNEQSTMYGYKVDLTSHSCPIFITYHKHEKVSASTAYGDAFINESALHWFTRSRRTLRSAEVRAIVDNELPLHLFAKKDDAEGTDFYYLGRARSSNAEQQTMPGGEGKVLDVVTMTLGMQSPIERSLYEYLISEGVDPSQAD